MGTEETGSKSGRFIEFEAPVFMDPDQNFWDQQPFQQPIDIACENHNVERSKLLKILRLYVVYYHERLTYLFLDEHSEEIRNDHAIQKVEKSKHIKRNVTSNPEEFKKTVDALKSVVNDLAPYPEWQVYVEEFLTLRSYKNDGAPDLDPFLVQTYPNWLAEKQRTPERSSIRQDSSILLGIDDIFPDDFGQHETQPVTKGEKRGNRRWRILRASELIPDRKKQHG